VKRAGKVGVGSGTEPKETMNNQAFQTRRPGKIALPSRASALAALTLVSVALAVTFSGWLRVWPPAPQHFHHGTSLVTVRFLLPINYWRFGARPVMMYAMMPDRHCEAMGPVGRELSLGFVEVAEMYNGDEP
jgi:hypothetical protein